MKKNRMMKKMEMETDDARPTATRLEAEVAEEAEAAAVEEEAAAAQIWPPVSPC
jgi:hypothetical protein